MPNIHQIFWHLYVTHDTLGLTTTFQIIHKMYKKKYSMLYRGVAEGKGDLHGCALRDILNMLIGEANILNYKANGEKESSGHG